LIWFSWDNSPFAVAPYRPYMQGMAIWLGILLFLGP